MRSLVQKVSDRKNQKCGEGDGILETWKPVETDLIGYAIRAKARPDPVFFMQNMNATPTPGYRYDGNKHLYYKNGVMINGFPLNLSIPK